MKRRGNLLEIIEDAKPIIDETYLQTARRLQQSRKPLYGLNKSKLIKGNPVIRIPERFAPTAYPS